MTTRNFFNSFLVLLFLTLGACQQDGTDPVPIDPINPLPSESEIGRFQVTSSELFSLNLLQEVNSQETNQQKNIFLAPLSIKIALAMVLNGADANTAAEIQNTLGFADLSMEQINADFQNLMEALPGIDPKVSLQIANSVWHDQTFTANPNFIQTLENVFTAEVQELDFKDPASPGIINDWVKNNTENKIDKILDQIDPNELMFLINAIYFKGDWAEPFLPELTTDFDFELSTNETKTVKMMISNRDVLVSRQDNYEAFELPYGDAKFGLTILLPNPGYSVDELIARLDENEWKALHENMITNGATVGLPKFEMEYDVDLNSVLQNMGIQEAFTDRANFSKLAEGVLISKVKHKTFLNVDEQGTEASGATSIGIAPTSARPILLCNRPFVMVIEERASNTIIFAGKIVNP